jgi:hypothetical protein
MKYVQRKFYIPEDIYAQMSWLAQSSGKSITEVVRGFITEGLEKKGERKNSMRNLLDLARKERKNWKGPADLADNHDNYFVEAFGKGD